LIGRGMNLKRLSQEWDRIISQVEVGIGIISLVGMVAVVNLNVFYRYFLKDPLQAWYLDLSQLFNLYMTFFVISYLYRQGQDIVIDIIVKRLPERVQNVIELIVQIAIGVTLVFILWYVWDWQKYQWYQMAGGLGISFTFFSIPYAIASVLMLVSNLKKIRRQVTVLLGNHSGRC
jgi:TRAP-type C4-dicarboxylate transport system permease small subunit